MGDFDEHAKILSRVTTFQDGQDITHLVGDKERFLFFFQKMGQGTHLKMSDKVVCTVCGHRFRMSDYRIVAFPDMGRYYIVCPRYGRKHGECCGVLHDFRVVSEH